MYDIKYAQSVHTNRQTHEMVTLKEDHWEPDPGDDWRGLGNVVCLPLSHSSGHTMITMRLLPRHWYCEGCKARWRVPVKIYNMCTAQSQKQWMWYKSNRMNNQTGPCMNVDESGIHTHITIVIIPFYCNKNICRIINYVADMTSTKPGYLEEKQSCSTSTLPAKSWMAFINTL